MASQHDRIHPEHRAFIEAQQMFFVATAAPTGRVNLSPKGLDSLRVLDDNHVVWLNGTGSGNETAAHLLADPRMTLMFCSFAGKPWILRLYGTATMTQPGDQQWSERVATFPAMLGARQVVELTVDLVQTSCGFGVPLYDYQGQRDLMHRWADTKGPEGIVRYQQDKNRHSIDGFDTGLPSPGPAGVDPQQ